VLIRSVSASVKLCSMCLSDHVDAFSIAYEDVRTQWRLYGFGSGKHLGPVYVLPIPFNRYQDHPNI